ncbi:hypothetical protein L207DRAFT_308498 [Hyaloscypha variabilis F]|uniref:Uncharacterized protein n=1 Tax=Hyaloscypha variabilis (strain UAMH 11265 / GT02V1 / F) TaxID=1149755 RepID=A0A2J6RUW7_HYAVF|nr:hypothetical protein L207DRAFT_308498 [Hyaloscypha variabilis F]
MGVFNKNPHKNHGKKHKDRDQQVPSNGSSSAAPNAEEYAEPPPAYFHHPCNKVFTNEDKVPFDEQRDLISQKLGFEVVFNYQSFRKLSHLWEFAMLSRLVDEYHDRMTKEELKTTIVELRRNGVSEGQLAFFDFCCIHNDESTPEKYLVARGK